MNKDYAVGALPYEPIFGAEFAGDAATGAYHSGPAPLPGAIAGHRTGAFGDSFLKQNVNWHVINKKTLGSSTHKTSPEVSFKPMISKYSGISHPTSPVVRTFHTIFNQKYEQNLNHLRFVLNLNLHVVQTKKSTLLAKLNA